MPAPATHFVLLVKNREGEEDNTNLLVYGKLLIVDPILFGMKKAIEQRREIFLFLFNKETVSQTRTQVGRYALDSPLNFSMTDAIRVAEAVRSVMELADEIQERRDVRD